MFSQSPKPDRSVKSKLNKELKDALTGLKSISAELNAEWIVITNIIKEVQTALEESRVASEVWVPNYASRPKDSRLRIAWSKENPSKQWKICLIRQIYTYGPVFIPLLDVSLREQIEALELLPLLIKEVTEWGRIMIDQIERLNKVSE